MVIAYHGDKQREIPLRFCRGERSACPACHERRVGERSVGKVIPASAWRWLRRRRRLAMTGLAGCYYRWYYGLIV
jgi:hypothetical protein